MIEDYDHVETPPNNEPEHKDYIPFTFSTCQDYVDYLDEADLECLVDKWLEPIGLGWIIAKSNTGKTNFIIDLGMHIASGHDWYGNKVKQGHVYYFSLEGGKKGIAQRIITIQKIKPKLYEDGFGYFHPTRDPFDLSNDFDKKRLIDQMKETNNKPSMIIYDTLSEVHNARENNIEEMKTIIKRLREISNELNCFVMVLHHFGKNAENGGRGASSQLASIDTELSLEPTPQGFSCRDTKQRDLPKHFDPIYFDNHTIELENKRGKKFSGIYIEQGQPSDPLHTTGLNQIMDVVREHQSTGIGELFRKDIVKKTGKDQGQVSRGVNNLIEKGRLAETSKRAIFIPSRGT